MVSLSRPDRVIFTDVSRQVMLSIVPKSGARLHQILLKTVLHAPMRYFSTTDSGVILNRFSQDMTLVEGVLPTTAFGTFLGKLTVIVWSSMGG